MRKLIIVGMVLCILTVLVGSASAGIVGSIGKTGGTSYADGTTYSGSQTTSTAATSVGHGIGVYGSNSFGAIGAGDYSLTSVGTTSIAESNGGYTQTTSASGATAGSFGF